MNKMKKDSEMFEMKLASALRASGRLFPIIDEELDYVLENSEPMTLPEKYQTSDFVFKEETPASTKKGNVKTVDFSETAQNWVLAARNGKDLPQSILNKMKEDKKKSQKK